MTLAERNAKIVHAYVSHRLPMRVIAGDFGLSHTQVHRILCSGGVVLRSRLRENRPWSEPEVAALIEHWPFLPHLLWLLPTRTKDAIRGKARALGRDRRDSHSLRRSA